MAPLASAADDTSAAAVSPSGDDAYCEAAREAAKSKAVLLIAPRVVAQAIKFPAGGSLQLTPVGVTSALYQLRTYADWSLTDAYRGVLTLALGELDCRRREFERQVDIALRAGPALGRREALTREIDFLTASEPVIAALERDAEARRRAEVATLSELEEIRERAEELRTARLEAADMLTELEAAGVTDPNGPIAPEAESYVRASMDYERLDSRIRQVAPWGLSINGGVASSASLTGTSWGTAVDWFGMIQVSYNLGGVAQADAERGLLAARQRELQSDPEQKMRAARAVDTALAKSVAVLNAQIQLLTDAARSLRAQIEALEKADMPNRVQMESVLKLRSLMAQARLVYLRALVERRQPWEEPSRD